MIAGKRRIGRATAIGLVGLGAACIDSGGLVRQARADPWIPASGDGVIKPMVRLFHGDRAYPADAFTTRTKPASNKSMTQYRVTGVAGLGDEISLEYDLRGGRVRSFTNHHHVPRSRVAWGLQDQEVGLNFGLVQRRDFAESAEINIVIPTGSTKPAPSLGTGRWAVEPDYQLGFARRWGSFSLVTGPRIFLDGNATQLRATLDLSFRAARRFSVIGEAFLVRTILHNSRLPPGALGEIYNLVRVGGGVEYRLTRRFRPFIRDDITIAGKGIHAGNRIEIGVAVHY